MCVASANGDHYYNRTTATLLNRSFFVELRQTRMAETRRIAITGASGFVGRHVLPQLLARGHRVRALARNAAGVAATNPSLEVVQGDLGDDDALSQLVKGVDTVVHIVGIIMEKPDIGQTFERIHAQATSRLVAAARKAGVKRWIHMSALGSRPDAVSRYHKTKWAAEQAVRSSGMAWTIFRPSIIHGPDGEFMQMVRDFWCKAFPPFVPYFGTGLVGTGGAGRLQPVWVEDVARCFAQAVTTPGTEGETYALGGPDAMTWPELYNTCRRHIPTARKKKVVPVPVWYARLIAGLPGVPFNLDQVIMSQEDSICGMDKAQNAFGFELSPFESTFAGYAPQLLQG